VVEQLAKLDSYS